MSRRCGCGAPLEVTHVCYPGGYSTHYPSGPIFGDGKRVCPTCKGTGINPVARYMVCPKCNGECRVPVREAVA